MIEPTLVTTIKTVCPQVYPDVAPEGAVMPFVTFQQVGGVEVSFLSGVANKKNARMQINVNAASRMQSMTLMREIEDLLIHMAADTARRGRSATYVDAITPIYESRQDFSIWG